VLGVVLFVLLSVVAGWDGGTGAWLARGALALAFGLGVAMLRGLVLVGRRYERWRYRFGEEALEIEQGIWWRTSSAVPYQRIQQVEIEHGPVERRLGLVGLALRTASASSLGSLPGVAESEAVALRGWLLRRAGHDDGA
jgi:uncharacterized protein